MNKIKYLDNIIKIIYLIIMEIIKEIEDTTSLNKNEVEEQENYIADKTGFLIKDVSKCLLILCVHLKHYIIPKHQNKIYTEYAKW